MGLSSVLSTAITGLQASETSIDVAGNNVANSNTVGFKSSTALFGTQFLQTLSLGSAPTATNGGKNPMQVGLGTQVLSIVPNFTQGTLEISSNPSDLAIQGDGFFVVQATTGETLYTRNGKFQVNSANELVTLNGERLLGYAVDENFEIQTTTLEPLTVPLGSAAVAKATENVYLEGTLTPTGQVADRPTVLQSAILSDGAQAIPDNTTTLQGLVQPADATTVAGGAGLIEAGTYQYKIVFVDHDGNEGPVGAASTALVVGANTEIDLSNIQTAASLNLDPVEFPTKRIYRTDDIASPQEYRLVDEIAENLTVYTDNTPQATLDAFLPPDGNVLTSDATLAAGDYSYYVVFYNSATGEESRPAQQVSLTVVGGRRIRLDNIPQPNPADTGNYDQIRIYRSTSDNSASHYHVAFLNIGQSSYIDSVSDSMITNTDPLVNPNYSTVDLHGPAINPGLALVDVVRFENGVYTHPFEPGTLSFVGRKGGRALAPKTLEITPTTTVQQLLDFIESAMGVQTIGGTEGGAISLGTSQLQMTGNNGTDNSLEIGLSAFTLTPVGSTVPHQVNLGFGMVQEARGQSAVADVVVYDSLGIPLNVRVTAVLDSISGTTTTYRWFADSPDNDPANTDPAAQVRIAVGTGLVSFDGEGKLISVTNSAVTIDRVDVPSASPLEFRLDFSQISGLAASNATLAATRQDGFPPGKLTSFIVGEDGVIRGVFDNGTQRDLGQIRLARFANSQGLIQRGQNLFAAGVNSGLPIFGNPSEQGIGSIIAGAVELSNTDIGENLINLILASTQYRGNARVISAAQQLLDELMNLRR